MPDGKKDGIDPNIRHPVTNQIQYIKEFVFLELADFIITAKCTACETVVFRDQFPVSFFLSVILLN